MDRISLQTVTMMPAAPTTRTGAPAAASAAPAATQQDHVQISSLAVRSSATWLPQPSRFAPPRIDFVQFLTGVKAGQKLTIDGGMLVGGSGSVIALSSDAIRLNLTIKAAFHKAQPMIIDVRRQGDSYVMKAPYDWDLDVTKSGNTVTLTNKANPKEKFIITAGKYGQFDVQTRGIGFDSTTLKISSK